MINIAYTSFLGTGTSTGTQVLTLTLPYAGVNDIDVYLVYMNGCDYIYQII